MSKDVIMDGKSFDIEKSNLELLKSLMPDVFSEDKIDFERLKISLGEEAIVQNEHYELSWAGKVDSRKEVQKQTTATLNTDFENSIDFTNADNIFIEGENLEVLRVIQKSYFGRVKMIYIDPPYNTGNDSFVYPDDYSERLDEYRVRTGVTNDQGMLNKQDLWKKNTKENGQFHSVWLSMMYPRLYLARNLLTEDGLIFISIDDNEVANLKLIVNEIFGSENFACQIVWQRHAGGGNDAKYFATDHEYILCIAKNLSTIQRLRLPLDNEDIKEFNQTDEHYEKLGRYKTKSFYRMRPDDPRPGLQYNITCPDGSLLFGEWKWEEVSFLKALEENKVILRKDNKGCWVVEYKIYQKDDNSNDKQKVPRSLIVDSKKRNSAGKSTLSDMLGTPNIFNNPKPIELLKNLIQIGTEADLNHIVLDFFAGSGSTGQAVIEQNAYDNGNRKFILVQLPELCEVNSIAYKEGYYNIAQISRTRIKNCINDQINKQSEQINFTSCTNTGLKCFKLASSNFKSWLPAITGKDMILEQLTLFKETIKESTEFDMVFELVLKYGLALTSKIEKSQYDIVDYYIIDNKYFILFDVISMPFCDFAIKACPKQIICLDRVFNQNDQFKTNISLRLKEASVSFKTI